LLLLVATRPPPPDLFPYTTLFRSSPCNGKEQEQEQDHAYTDLLALQLHRLCHPVHEVGQVGHVAVVLGSSLGVNRLKLDGVSSRSEEHTSELQSRENIVCRLLLEK